MYEFYFFLHSIKGKRPLSSMCPAIFVDPEGEVRLVVGGSGGTKISSSVTEVSMNNLWFGKDIKESIDTRRLHHQLFPMSIGFEEKFDKVTFQMEYF